MSIVALSPTPHAHNAMLEAQGFGPSNFTLPCAGSTGYKFSVLHAWDDADFLSALQLLPGIIIYSGGGQPTDMTQALVANNNASRVDTAQELPDTGNVTAGQLYLFEGALWAVIQTHNRSTYGGDPAQYPALIRELRRPGEVKAWRQPLDQYDSFRLVNPFTGQPDECLHAGKRWRTTIDFNVYEPGSLNGGWVEVDEDGNVIEPPEPEPDEWPLWVQPTGGHDAYRLGAKVTHNGQRWLNTGSDANVWEPGVFGWTVAP